MSNLAAYGSLCVVETSVSRVLVIYFVTRTWGKSVRLDVPCITHCHC